MRETERETAVILKGGDRFFAISVDVASSIEKFAPGAIEEIPALVPIGQNGVVRRLAKRAKSKDVVLIIETDGLMAGVDLDALQAAESPALALSL